MSYPQRLRILWRRYAAPTRAESEPGFRAVLDASARLGVRMAGVFGLVALLGVGISAVATAWMGGSGMGSSADFAAQALSDKLFVFAAAGLFLPIAYVRPGLSASRVMLGLYVIVAGAVLTSDDIARADLEFLAGWLALLLVLAVGTVPFQPIQTFVLGIFLTVLHTLAVVLLGLTVAMVDTGEAVRRLTFMLLVTFVGTLMSVALFATRRAQYYGTLRLARLRDRLQDRGRQLEANVERLQNAQNQLVQQEKMASLGQLTAGVAHELKNPLNFVNNFAQLSAELLDDLEDELREEAKRPVGEALDDSADLLADLRSNASKIREHGRRADGIIRSMLAHSRAQPGPMRPAPVNSLLREYVGLAYHGTRASHSGFNVDIQLELDDAVQEVLMVPEEMGRVFLNLLDNALQALRQRADAEPGFTPVLRVTTRPWQDDGVSVSVQDNGSGIPAEVRDRIFEPFFTTKPTGEGTGLGLSLAYEIVVHGHGGYLKVNSRQDDGTTFTVQLPGVPVDSLEGAEV
ncbi:MAG: ATP-binding protein [Bacteroidota bacterium]